MKNCFRKWSKLGVSFSSTRPAGPSACVSRYISAIVIIFYEQPDDQAPCRPETGKQRVRSQISPPCPRPCPSPLCSLSLIFNSRRSYWHRRMMKLKSALGHLPEHEAERVKSRRLNDAQKAATEQQRARLRSTSINPSSQVNYDQSRKRPAQSELPRPRTRPRRDDLELPKRLAAIRERLWHPHIDRYDDAGWSQFHKRNVAALKPLYQRSTIPHRLIARAC